MSEVEWVIALLCVIAVEGWTAIVRLEKLEKRLQIVVNGLFGRNEDYEDYKHLENISNQLSILQEELRYRK